MIQIAIVGDLINPIMVYLDGENDDSTKGFVKKIFSEKTKTTFVWKNEMDHQQTVEDHTVITRQILQPMLTRVMATPGVSCDTKVWGICDSDMSDILLKLEIHTGHDL